MPAYEDIVNKAIKVKKRIPAFALQNAEEAKARYFNRELSWLKFNWRVLEEGQNRNHPLFERLRFLSISGNNLDEFFMVRVAGLRGQQIQRIDEWSIDGMNATQQLDAIEIEADALMTAQQALWLDLLQELTA